MVHYDFKVTKDTQFAVLGLGKFSKGMVKTLVENDYNVLCCDIDKNVVHEVAQYATHVIEGDVNDPAVLESIGLGNFDVVIISLSEDFEAAIITTMIAKEKNVPLVIAKATGLRQKKILENVGADLVVLPEMEMGEKTAYHLINNDPMHRIHQSDHYDVEEIVPHHSWVGKSLRELSLRQTEGINVLTIIRNDEIIASMDPELIIEADDILVVLKLL